MSMTKPAAIYDALATYLAQVDTGSPALPISFPEPVETFVPPADGRYLDASHFNNTPAWVGLNRSKIDQGIFLVTVVWPKNDGLIRPMSVAGLVEAHFATAPALVSNGHRVKPGVPFVASAVVEPDSVRIPVTIPWTA